MEDRSEQQGQVAQTAAFRELMRRKKAFIITAAVFFMVFYFTLPILTAFTTLLNGKVVGDLTWAYVYAFAQFAMTWMLCHLYLSRANVWDELAERAWREVSERKEENK